MEDAALSMIASTPEPPYYAVIFTSLRTASDDGFLAMAEKMLLLAARQPGFIGVESARSGMGITVSYWSDIESINQWKNNAQHQEAQKLGREKWYSAFQTRVALVERHGAADVLAPDDD